MKTKCILALLLAVFYFAALAFEPLDLSVVVPFEVENSKNITANLSDLDKSPSRFVGARLDLPKAGILVGISFQMPELIQFLHLTSQSETLEEVLFRQLSSFTNLKYLLLTCPNVKAIPNEIVLLTNNCQLISLSLFAKSAVSLSENVYKIGSLRELRVRFQELRMPDGLTQLTNLDSLAIYGAKPFRAPNDLQYTHIRDFVALSCRFADDDAPILPATIRVLNLAGDKLQGLPKGLDSYSQLEVLYLHGNEISEIPSDWRKLFRLQYIQLRNNKLANVGPLQLPESMVNIDLSGNKVKPASGSTLDPRIILD